MALLSDTRLGIFEITDLLGEGGMGQVYRARDTKLDREVAIKVLHEESAEDRDLLARFEREAKLLASLDHPNIGALYDFQNADGVHFLVMQLIEGETLADRIARGPVPVREALPLFVQIAEALEVAHERGIVHRDLKPGNVMVGKDGKAKVLDFGIGKSFHPVKTPSSTAATPASGSDQTRTATVGANLGTPSYMSPEQVRGEEAGTRADVWAFGCCLFETLTGRRAFVGATLPELKQAVIQSEPDWGALPDNVAPEIRTLLSQCLEKDPKKRMRDMGDIAHLVEYVSAAQRFSRQERPWRRSAPWLAVAALAVLGGVVLWPASQNRKDGGPPPRNLSGPASLQSVPDGENGSPVPLSPGTVRVAVLPFVNATSGEDLEWLGQGFCETITNELSQSDLLTVVERSQIDKILAELDFEHTQWVDVTTAQEVGRILGVDYVVIGSFQIIDNQVRVNSRQVRTASGEVIRADTLDGLRTEVFQLQERTGQSMREILEEAGTTVQP